MIKSPSLEKMRAILKEQGIELDDEKIKHLAGLTGMERAEHLLISSAMLGFMQHDRIKPEQMLDIMTVATEFFKHAVVCETLGTFSRNGDGSPRTDSVPMLPILTSLTYSDNERKRLRDRLGIMVLMLKPDE